MGNGVMAIGPQPPRPSSTLPPLTSWQRAEHGCSARYFRHQSVRLWQARRRLRYRGNAPCDLPPKKWTGLGRHTLSESSADVAQGRMQAAGIVEALDILEEVSTSLGAGAINPMVNPLGLEAVKEALHWRIVEAVAF